MAATNQQGNAPAISVVVCTRNRADQLASAIASLQDLDSSTGSDFEILVVDNNSSDDTRTVVDKAAGNAGPPIRYVFEQTPGVAFARNRGVAEAAGDWIAFFDDDQHADPRWLLELQCMAIEKCVLCVGGQVKLKLPPGATRDLGPVCRDLLSETVNQPKARRYDRRFKPGAGNLMIHRRVIDDVGGFSTGYNDRGEDTILFLKLLQAGYESWYTPDAVVYHNVPNDRLTDQAFHKLTRQVGQRMPAFEKEHWKRWFPLAWSARIAQTVCIFVPRWVIARLSGDADRILEADCQLLMARTRIRHGVKWLFGGNPLSK